MTRSARLGMVRSTLTAAMVGPASRCQRTSSSASGRLIRIAAASAVNERARCWLAAVSTADRFSTSQASTPLGITDAPSASDALRCGGAQAPFDPLQRFVGCDREQGGEKGAHYDLGGEILGDALEDDVAQSAGIDVGRDGCD